MTTDAEVFGDGQAEGVTLTDAEAGDAIERISEFCAGSISGAVFVALHFLRLREQGKSVDEALYALAWTIAERRDRKRDRLRDTVEGPYIHVSPLTGIESRYGSGR